MDGLDQRSLSCGSKDRRKQAGVGDELGGWVGGGWNRGMLGMVAAQNAVLSRETKTGPRRSNLFAETTSQHPPFFAAGEPRPVARLIRTRAPWPSTPARKSSSAACRRPARARAVSSRSAASRSGRVLHRERVGNGGCGGSSWLCCCLDLSKGGAEWKGRGGGCCPAALLGLGRVCCARRLGEWEGGRFRWWGDWWCRERRGEAIRR
jgi:hypothetical protein